MSDKPKPLTYDDFSRMVAKANAMDSATTPQPIVVTTDQKAAIEAIKAGTVSVLESARLFMPDASDEELDHIIWAATGFPSFWKTDNPELEFMQQLSDAAVMRRAGTLNEYIKKAWDLPGTHDERVKDADT